MTTRGVLGLHEGGVEYQKSDELVFDTDYFEQFRLMGVLLRIELYRGGPLLVLLTKVLVHLY
jgi:hypothetical protein